MVKECALSTGNLPWGGLLRNIVDRITDRPDMTSAVDHGCKASAQPNRTLLKPFIHGHVLRIRKFCIYILNAKNLAPRTFLHFIYKLRFSLKFLN